MCSTLKSLLPTALTSPPTPKINRVRSIDFISDIMTFTGPYIFLTHKIVSIIFLVMILLYSALLPVRSNNVLLRTHIIFIRKWISSVTNVVSIFLWFRQAIICWHGFLRLAKNTCGYYSCTFETTNSLYRSGKENFSHTRWLI